LPPILDAGISPSSTPIPNLLAILSISYPIGSGTRRFWARDREYRDNRPSARSGEMPGFDPRTESASI
jgi:hypothetical protein